MYRNLVAPDPPVSTSLLRREQQTMLMSLYLHARDARSARPVLHDTWAVRTLAAVGHDEAELRTLRGNGPLVVARALRIDELVRDWVHRHPEGVVLHLGCGLDSRVLRVDPGAGVTWVEVDQAPVVALRRGLFPDREGVVTVAASVTESAWWHEVPAGRPVLAVAEGVLMYLAPEQVGTVVDRLAELDAPSTELVADTVAPWVRRVAAHQSSMRGARTGFASTTADLGRAVAAHPRFASSPAESLVAAAARAATGPLRGVVELVDRVPGGHRAMVLTSHRAGGA